ncbi:hypothetical protein LY474_11275 [Myxococcus stipitatus]|uniref:hypothetical protein n=1 Tax=Myxococcus stipitatus TaxID=83455 RepID=UPI001F287D97|nr:hypothetical protein [Myxococcus stipitatus]MCE9668394.1 hypothetical protein [Myxococcus stipitatus]
MKAWTAVAVLALSLVGCGNSRELTRAKAEANILRSDTKKLQEENEALKEKVTGLELELTSVTKERDELKAAAEQAAQAPAAVPASGKKRKK